MGVTVSEVGPRDGLQNEAVVLPTARKIELVERLTAAGLRRIEVGSFVHPKAVPQMADTDLVFTGSRRDFGTLYTGLVLNEKGFDRLLASDSDQANFALAVTETFNLRNQRATPAESMAEFGRIAARARSAGKRCSITFGAAFGCPFEGEVPESLILRLAEQAAAAGADEILLADTIGVAVPTQVSRLVRGVRGVTESLPVGVHLHNTRNTGYANAWAALEAGAEILDASVGGIGGCPFAPRATGNIATEDLVYMLHRMGVETGVDLEALMGVSLWLEEEFGRPLPGHLTKAGLFPAQSRS